MRTFDVPVVVGAGPAGLSAGYALTRAGVRPKLLDRGDQIASSWRSYYDTLRLNSPRVLSSLPGMTIDPGAGRFPSRIDFILYLERYARRWDLDMEFGVDVRRVDRADGDGWLLRTGQGTMWAPQVVVATGLYAEPIIPAWPGKETFTKELLHIREFRNAKAYEGSDVLVVGGGQSAADVAMEAVAVGARRVRLSVRTPPHIARPVHFGVSPSAWAFVVKCQPRWLDGFTDWYTLNGQRLLRRSVFRDLEQHGFGAPDEGLATALRTRHRGILIDRGLTTALKAGQIEAVPAVEALDGEDVVLAGGRRIRPDVVICGTGARVSLPSLVGHLGVLQPDGLPLVQGGRELAHAKGLYFIGYRLPPGVLPDARRDAPAIARRITGRWTLPLPAWRTSGKGYPRGRERAARLTDVHAGEETWRPAQRPREAPPEERSGTAASA